MCEKLWVMSTNPFENNMRLALNSIKDTADEWYNETKDEPEDKGSVVDCTQESFYIIRDIVDKVYPEFYRRFGYTEREFHALPPEHKTDIVKRVNFDEINTCMKIFLNQHNYNFDENIKSKGYRLSHPKYLISNLLSSCNYHITEYIDKLCGNDMNCKRELHAFANNVRYKKCMKK